MAARTIDSRKDRLVTILVAPLMSCSARLPVYVLLIAACFPGRAALSSVILLAMYVLGIVVALAMASIFKKTLLKGETPILVMELPPYKRPMPGVILRHVLDPAKLFLVRAGTIILGINILIWFLTAYPKPSAQTLEQFASQRAAITAQAGQSQSAALEGSASGALSAEQQAQLGIINAAESSTRLENSVAGRFGRVIEPLIAPLGFDWKIGIGLVSSFAAREMFVSTMAIVYNVSVPNEEAKTRQLAEVMREQKRPDGTPLYTTLTTLTLMVFYALALQCVSTIAVVRRETNSWRWPAFQWLYMGALAWTLAFGLYHGGRWLGLH
jgi:ferrous iron transport protein B